MVYKSVTVHIWMLHKLGMYETLCFVDSDERVHVYEEGNAIRFKYIRRHDMRYAIV